MKKIYKICSLAVSLMVGVIMVCSFVFAEQSDMNMTFTKTLSNDNLSVVINGQVSSDIYEIIGIQEEGKERTDGITTIETTVTENKEYKFAVFYKDKSNAEITDQTQLIEEIPELNQVYTIEVTEIPEKVVLPEEIQTQEINEETNISLAADTQELTEYVFDENTKTITEYTGTSTDIVIPETIHNVTVENIGENVFKDKGITSVVFPNSIKKIGDYAFCNHELNELILPKNLEDIGNDAFARWFQDHPSFTNLKISKSVKYIRSFAFYGCGIKNLSFAKDCTLKMAKAAFSCNEIKDLDLSVGNITLKIEGEVDGYGQPVETGYAFYRNAIESVKFSPYMSEIPIGTFGYNQFKSLEIPVTIKVVGEDAFSFNEQLENVKVNEGVISIERRAFYASPVKSIELPKTLLKLGGAVFERTSLPYFEIPDNVIDNVLDEALIYGTSISSDIIQKNNQWKLDLKSLDDQLKIDRIENVYVASVDTMFFPTETFELSSIGGKYDKDTGILTFNGELQDKKIVYEYRMTDNEKMKYPLMKVVIKSENIIVHTDITFDTVEVRDYRVGDSYGELPVPTKIGYAFKEWNTLSDGTGETITSDTIVTNENEHTLYPIFTPVSYEVTLIADNYNQVKNVYYDSPYGELPVIEKTGFDFIGWNTQSDGKGQFITQDTVLNLNENHTLYAIYKKPENNSSDNNQTSDGEIILPGEDGEIGTDDDIIVKPGTIDDKGNIIIPDGGVIIYPDGNEEDFLNGGIILTGEDGEIGTSDDIIVKPGTIDDKGNVIILDGGAIIYPDGSQEDFPNGAVIKPGDDGQVGTKDDIIIDSGSIDDQGNIIISNGGAIIYPDGKREEFPDGGVIITDKNGDEVIIKSGQLDNQGNIIISDGGMIIYPDGTRKSFPKGGIIRWGKDGKLEIEDLNEVNNQGLISTEQNNIKSNNYVLTNDDVNIIIYILLTGLSLVFIGTVMIKTSKK